MFRLFRSRTEVYRDEEGERGIVLCFGGLIISKYIVVFCARSAFASIFDRYCFVRITFFLVAATFYAAMCFSQLRKMCNTFSAIPICVQHLKVFTFVDSFFFVIHFMFYKDTCRFDPRPRITRISLF